MSNTAAFKSHQDAVDKNGLMDLRYLLTNFTDGDGLGWPAEFTWLRTFDHRIIADLTVSIAREGFKEPIQLGTDGRIWDGHHRLCVAESLYWRRIPVEFAADDYDETREASA